nr:DUF4369 domain-containing protein [Chitinophagaceae bacterium]
MKFLFIIVYLFCFATPVKSQGYQVTLQAPDFKNGLAYLTYYYGANINIEDSALINNKGVAVFKKDKKLPPGIYSIVFPGKNKLFDFFVAQEQLIVISADTSDLLNKTSISGSKENILFQQYQKYIAVKGKELQKEQQAFSSSISKSDSLLHEKNYKTLNKELNQYRENVILQYPNSMLATLFKSMREPGILLQKPLTKNDSISNYNYYKKHFWDGISFMD